MQAFKRNAAYNSKELNQSNPLNFKNWIAAIKLVKSKFGGLYHAIWLFLIANTKQCCTTHALLTNTGADWFFR